MASLGDLETGNFLGIFPCLYHCGPGTIAEYFMYHSRVGSIEAANYQKNNKNRPKSSQKSDFLHNLIVFESLCVLKSSTIRAKIA